MVHSFGEWVMNVATWFFFNKDAKIELKQDEAGMGDAREIFPKFRNKSTVFSCGWEKRAEIER
jgi:hypothetical protein